MTSRKRKLEETREEGEDRTSTLRQLAAESSIAKSIEEQLLQYAANDPEKIKQVEEYATVAKLSANRWTDNIHEMVRFFKSRMSDFNATQFMKHFELPEDLESV